jgi:molybdopterin-guanine dinucleotide biosynthesis protein A
LGGRVVRAFVSVRTDQQNDTTRTRHALIVDRGDIEGPIAGINAAFARFPDAAWLVLACDLPFLDARTLDTLIAARAADHDATAFRSSHDGLPEPLCAIYEPRSRAGLAAHIAAGRNCPRKFLISAHTRVLEQPNPRSLDNVNTVDEYRQAMSVLNTPERAISDDAAPERPIPERKIRVQYYALLREQAGRSDETLTTGARDARELYAELRTRYPFTLPAEMLRVAINAEFGDWSQPLRAGDAVVFIPPVAGG